MAAGLLAGCMPVVTPVAAVQARQTVPSTVLLEAPPVPASPLGSDGLLTQEAFAAELVLALQRARPGWIAVAEGGDIIVLWRGQEPGPSLLVGPAYRAFRLAPGEQEVVIADAVAEALRLFEAAPGWEQAQVQIMPRLMSTGHYQLLEEGGYLPVSFPLSDDLTMVFELVTGGEIFLVDQGSQARWEASAMALLVQAVGNLEAYTPMPVMVEDGLYMFPVTDGYAAERVLLVDLLGFLDQLTPGALIVAIPARDRFYAFEADNEALVSRMRVQTQNDFRDSAIPLSPVWLTLYEGRLTIYENAGG